MKCKEAYTCLLAAQSPLAPPLEVQEHIQRCASCRRRQQRLSCLEAELRQLPRPGEQAQSRARLFEKLAELEPPLLVAASGPPLRPRTMSPKRVGLFFPLTLAASVVLLYGLLTYLLFSNDNSPSPQVGAHTLPAPTVATPANEAVGRVLESDLRLAQGATASEQVTALADIAQALETEVYRLARVGAVEDTLLVGGLYERVLYQGVLARSRSLSAQERDALSNGLQLQRSADEAEQLARTSSPGVAQALRLLGSAARTTGHNLHAQAPGPTELQAPAWTPARTGTSRDLLGTLVVQGLRLAGEMDPLRRADLCSDVADHLVQSILLASASGDSVRAEQLGGFLGSVMDQGVGVNLGKVQTTGPVDARAKEAAKIGERSAQSVEALEKNLQKAPPEARPGLQKALDASSNGGKDKHWKHGKGKGKFGK